MLYKKLDSRFDIEELYDIWSDIVKYSCFPSNEDLADKYFSLLNEYYANPNRTFSNWNLVFNSIEHLNTLSAGKISIKNKDLLMLGVFMAFMHFDALTCSGFERSAYESIDMLDHLGLNEDERRFVFSQISSLDYYLVYDKEKSYASHCMRDSCFFWFFQNPEEYLDIVRLLKIEANADEDTWAKCRKDLLTYGLESQVLMHIDGPSASGYHLAIQNNFLDELNLLNKSNMSTAV